MANSQAQAKYERKRLDVITKLKSKGFPSGFGSKIASDDPRVSDEYSEICQEHYFPIDSETFKDIIESGESVLMVSNESKLLDTCDFMSSEERTIRKKKAFPEGAETPIFYECLVRG